MFFLLTAFAPNCKTIVQEPAWDHFPENSSPGPVLIRDRPSSKAVKTERYKGNESILEVTQA